MNLAAAPSVALLTGCLAAGAGWLTFDAPTRIALLPSPEVPDTPGQSRRSGTERWGAGSVRRVAIAAASGVVLIAAWFALIPTLTISAAGYVLLRRWRAHRRVSAQQRQRGEDVDTLRALAAELRSGLAPALALQAAGSSASAPRGIAARMLAAAAADAIGGDPAAVLSADAEPGSPAAALGAGWAVCRQTGARLAAPVARIAQGAAADLRIAREADATLAGARASAHLLAGLPIAGLGLGALSGAGSLHVLLATAVGQLCLLVGIALDLAGLAWLDRLAAAGSG